jgi:hypothetical protein
MEWISIKDKLPSFDQEVLAIGRRRYEEGSFKESLSIRLCTFYQKSRFRDYQWIFNTHCCDDYLIEVTHWMPLPESPKE